MKLFFGNDPEAIQILGHPESSFPTLIITEKNCNFRNYINRGRRLVSDQVFVIYLINVYSTFMCMYTQTYSLHSR